MERVPGPSDSERPLTGAHGLGPHVVGTRVVIRRLVRGELGPTGGPALTDVLGVCESWADGPEGSAVVRREDGEMVAIATADIVSGKPVPPREPRASRLSAHELERRAASMLRPAEQIGIGEWSARFDGTGLKRANSVLTSGDPGRPLADALAAVRAFYDAHGAPARLQVVLGSEIDEAVTALGWRPAFADGPPVHAQVVPVARAARLLRGIDTTGVRRAERLDAGWFLDAPAADELEHARQLLETDAVFTSIEEVGRTVARGRAAYDDDWVTITNMSVRPDRRRRGLARAVLADLVDWAAERGASMLLLQVLVDNAPALALYAGAGFETHHTYRYVVAPAA